MTIDREVLERLARLAAIDLSPEELEALERDVDRIVSYCDQLPAVDSPVPGTMSSRRLAERQDLATPNQYVDTRTLFRRTQEGFLVVPPLRSDSE